MWLQSSVTRLTERAEATPLPELEQTLIREKNAEIDHLQQQLSQLRAHGHAADDQVHIQQLVSARSRHVQVLVTL